MCDLPVYVKSSIKGSSFCQCCKENFLEGTVGKKYKVLYDRRGFVYLTKLMNDYFPDYSFSDFRLHNNDLIDHLDSFVKIAENIDAETCLIERDVVPFAGKWAHPYLVIHILSFYDNQFALSVSQAACQVINGL